MFDALKTSESLSFRSSWTRCDAYVHFSTLWVPTLKTRFPTTLTFWKPLNATVLACLHLLWTSEVYNTRRKLSVSILIYFNWKNAIWILPVLLMDTGLFLSQPPVPLKTFEYCKRNSNVLVWNARTNEVCSYMSHKHVWGSTRTSGICSHASRKYISQELIRFVFVVLRYSCVSSLVVQLCLFRRPALCPNMPTFFLYSRWKTVDEKGNMS